MPADPMTFDFEGEDIVVTASRPSPTVYLVPGSSGGSFEFRSIIFTEFRIEDHPDFLTAAADKSAPDIVGKTVEYTGEVLKAALKVGGYILNPREYQRLDALADSMIHLGKAVSHGDLSVADGRAAFQSALVVAIDYLGGAGMGILVGALAASASTFLPPHLRGLSIIGGTLLGIGLDALIDKYGLQEQLAGAITNALFDGAEAVADLVVQLESTLRQGINPFNQQAYDPFDAVFMDLMGQGGVSGSSDIDTVNYDAYSYVDYGQAEYFSISDWHGDGGGPRYDPNPTLYPV